MFSSLAKYTLDNNFRKDVLRYLCWVKNYGPYKLIGLNSEHISVFKGINKVNYPNTNTILKGEKLFEIETNEQLYNTFNSNHDCIIVEKNNNINLLDKNCENVWIIKIKDMGYNNHYKKFIKNNPEASKYDKLENIKKIHNLSKYTPYTYMSNSIDIDKSSNNLNINSIIGNH